MANIMNLDDNKYAIKIQNFEGPLDLLLHLIDKNKMDIYDIKINEITEQYVNYIKKMEEMNLIITSEFIIMASTLLYLKSKKLLPKLKEDEEEITEEELIRRIIEYKKYKEISSKFKENYENYSKRIFNLPEKITLPKQELENSNYSLDNLVKMYKELWNRNQEKINVHARNIEKIALVDKYTVQDKVKEMFKIMLHKPNFVFNKVYTLKKCNKQELVTAFSSLLELSRRNKVITTQNGLFGDIEVQRKRNKV